ncbi:unnamed protein product [Amaranthus hypochondriacus]
MGLEVHSSEVGI